MTWTSATVTMGVVVQRVCSESPWTALLRYLLTILTEFVWMLLNMLWRASYWRQTGIAHL